MYKIKDVKHKILDELYQVKPLTGQDTLVQQYLDIDTLQKNVNADRKEFYSSMELLHLAEEIFVSWKEKTAIITIKGIVSLNIEKYRAIKIQKRRDTVLFWVKVSGLIVLFLTFIRTLIELTDALQRVYPK